MHVGRCAVCGTEHEELEPGFRRPDAFFAVPEEQRKERVKDTNDMVAIDGAAFFVRGVAPVPVAGRSEPYRWGFWAKVSREGFEEYLRYFEVDPPEEHLGLRGTIANQTRLLPPTLGLPVHIWLGRGKARPSLTLLNAEHPLAQHQRAGVTEKTLSRWVTCVSRAEVVDPPSPRFSATLEQHGWCIPAPASVGRSSHVLAEPPRIGDWLKAPFRFLAADEHGATITRVEFMWVLIDLVEDGAWSGTLANNPTVPGPIDCGSRVWLDSSEVIGHQAAEAAQGSS